MYDSGRAKFSSGTNLKIDNEGLSCIISDRCCEKVQQAVQYIEDEYSNIQSVREIADYIQMNYHTLRDRFRRETRLRLKDFLTLTRLKHALFAISDNNKLIKEIAWDVGFKHEGQMVRVFHKYLKKTPQQVRASGRIARQSRKGLSMGRALLPSKKLLKKAAHL